MKQRLTLYAQRAFLTNKPKPQRPKLLSAPIITALDRRALDLAREHDDHVHVLLPAQPVRRVRVSIKHAQEGKNGGTHVQKSLNVVGNGPCVAI